MVVALLTANILALALWMHAWDEVQRRARVLAVAYMMLLWASPTFGLLADVFGIERRTVSWFHHWMGRTGALHSVLHAATALAAAGRPASLLAHISYTPLLVLELPARMKRSTGLGPNLAPPLLPFPNRRHPQFALKTHYLLAMTGTITLALHFGDIAIGLFLKLWGHPWPRLRVRLVEDLLWQAITVPHHWDTAPGQYVQVWVPLMGLRYALQLPFFYVTFSEDAADHREAAYPDPGAGVRADGQTMPTHRPASATAAGSSARPMEDFVHQRWILQFDLYYHRSSEDVPQPSKAASRIRLCPGRLQPDQTVQDQIDCRRGNMAVGGMSAPTIMPRSLHISPSTMYSLA
ncbi:hypothetical protein BDV23DRAFT_188710 [Aspergillus alliaceus]|uniref:Ferric oxidoreductase domain-containing protein n=1 Tax=Petromyces alliaceus TaxID=209559 RepID=A0A5N7BTA3_PETAA|nr:hypothetical protein BDV23DRAFT_188710 [Aspergillus alliaceus]